MLRGPSSPRMQVLTHLMVQDSAFLDLGLWILPFFLQSPWPCCDEHCPPDSVCGMFDRVSSSGSACCCCRDIPTPTSNAMLLVVPTTIQNINAAAAADVLTNPPITARRRRLPWPALQKHLGLKLPPQLKMMSLLFMWLPFILTTASTTPFFCCAWCWWYKNKHPFLKGVVQVAP